MSRIDRLMQLAPSVLAVAAGVLSVAAGMLFAAQAGGASAAGQHRQVAPHRRLTSAIASHADVGESIAIRLHDRLNAGGIRLSICITPPGGRLACRRWYLRAGRPRRTVRIRVARPGGWRVSVRSHYSRRKDRQVWVSHRGGRIRLLAAGDSEMQILDTFIAQDANRYGVGVTSDARISTGLTNSFFFDWPRHAHAEVASLQPDATVFFIGANDGFSVRDPHGHQISCCGADWSAGYASLVAQMMRIYLRGRGGRVYWFVLPTPRPGNFQRLFNAVNKGIRSAARRLPGRVALIDANAFFTPGNRYRNYMVYHGHGFVIHEPDGIHLSTAADKIDASLVVRRLLQDGLIR
jgi:lysophospholipase L1-like esterase